MSESNSPLSNNPSDAQHPSVSLDGAQHTNGRQISEIESVGRRPSQAIPRIPRRQGSPTPPPSRRPPPSPASSYTWVLHSVPAIQKWTVACLRQALRKADVYYSRRIPPPAPAHSKFSPYPLPEAWPTAPPPNSSMRLPPLAAQAHYSSMLPALSPLPSISAPQTRCQREAASGGHCFLFSLSFSRSFTLASAVLMPIPPNGLDPGTTSCRQQHQGSDASRTHYLLSLQLQSLSQSCQPVVGL
ncbi:hypothetical protein Q8A67_010102 [Cirrhinus molitorella]|uniref:Uncharacterized protein n=1 Tax=Cirrhinus molitorella TaxID=172907 RepID=A0AA88PRR1_9TELE|nr:hypothetical protein Q8A67_010102 [Cirrhinus molitorella]